MALPEHPHHRLDRRDLPWTAANFREHIEWRRCWLEAHLLSKRALTPTPRYGRLRRVITRVTGNVVSHSVPLRMLAATKGFLPAVPGRKGKALSHPTPTIAIGEWVVRLLLEDQAQEKTTL